MKIVAMVPARLGSQRLSQKNLLEINGKTIVGMSAEKCVLSGLFEEVYLNSESDLILSKAPNGCKKYKRQQFLADNNATSDDFIRDFLRNISCDYLIQVHSIAPLVTVDQISSFVSGFVNSGKQVGLTCEKLVLETVGSLGDPVNFTFKEKTNSQDLEHLRMINWCITGWRVDDQLLKEKCLSFGSSRFYYELPRTSSIVIKNREDYELCKKILEKQ